MHLDRSLTRSRAGMSFSSMTYGWSYELLNYLPGPHTTALAGRRSQDSIWLQMTKVTSECLKQSQQLTEKFKTTCWLQTHLSPEPPKTSFSIRRSLCSRLLYSQTAFPQPIPKVTGRSPALPLYPTASCAIGSGQAYLFCWFTLSEHQGDPVAMWSLSSQVTLRGSST